MHKTVSVLSRTWGHDSLEALRATNFLKLSISRMSLIWTFCFNRNLRSTEAHSRVQMDAAFGKMTNLARSALPDQTPPILKPSNRAGFLCSVGNNCTSVYQIDVSDRVDGCRYIAQTQSGTPPNSRECATSDSRRVEWYSAD